MKRVSFEVAKAIKDAGYPQSNMRNTFFNKQGELLVVTNINDRIEYDIYAPTYLDVWLWLCREKGIYLNTNTQRSGIVCVYLDDTIIHKIKDMKLTDPEEAIIAAIEYLTDNNLIK